MGYINPFKRYDALHDYVCGGRSPRNGGRKYTSAFRVYLRDDHIEIFNHNLSLAKLYPDDRLEFVATARQVWGQGNSLAMNIHKLLPITFQNFDTGRYKVVHEIAWRKLPHAEYRSRHNMWLEIRKEAQEYFQGLILNIGTGEIINPKDMTPETNEDKRKQWLAGLKSFRLRLRAMARVGAFDAYKGDEPRYHTYFSDDDLKALTEAIMSGEVSVETARLLAHCTSRWTAQKYSTYGEAVVAVFENTVKSNSRKLRLNAGVITIKG